MRHILFVLLLAVVALIATASSPISECQLETYYISWEKGLNIRYSPSIDSRIVGSLPYGSTVSFCSGQFANGYIWAELSPNEWIAITRMSDDNLDYIYFQPPLSKSNPTPTSIAEIDNVCFESMDCETEDDWRRGYFIHNGLPIPDYLVTPVATPTVTYKSESKSKDKRSDKTDNAPKDNTSVRPEVIPTDTPADSGTVTLSCSDGYSANYSYTDYESPGSAKSACSKAAASNESDGVSCSCK